VNITATAEGWTLVWLVFVLTLFGGIYFFLDQAGVSPADRIAPLVLLAVVVMIAAIWQAAGMAVARIHMMLEKVELDPGPGAGPQTLRPSDREERACFRSACG
jgi:hypothetical protein